MRLHMFWNHSVNFSTHVGLNCKHVVYIGYMYSGYTIVRLSLKSIWELDKLNPALVCLQIGSNDLCCIIAQVNDLVDKKVEDVEMFRGRGVRSVCVIKS